MPTFFDTETVPNLALAHLLPAITAPGQYKKPDSIAQWLAENGEAARLEQAARMALDPCLFRFRALAWANSVTAPPTVTVINDEAGEKAALAEFWNRLADPAAFPIIGYNILAFDLPRLLWRSMALGVAPTVVLDMGRYSSSDALDMLLALKGGDMKTCSLAGMGLKPVGEMLGLPNPLPGVDGSQVAAMSDDEVRVYAGADITRLQQLYLRMAGVYFLPLNLNFKALPAAVS